MNKILTTLWLWQARRKIRTNDNVVKYTCIHRLGELGNENDIPILVEYLPSFEQSLRIAAAAAIKQIYLRSETAADIEADLLDLFRQASLMEKLSVLEILRVLPLSKREEILGPLLKKSEDDLKYALISSLQDTEDERLLDAVIEASSTTDLVLRKRALQTWYYGIADQEINDIITYATPRLHFLIRATYELQTDGIFLKNVLSYSNVNELPSSKAYPDFMIRYLNELLSSWEFDPEAYRALHSLVVPSYFTFSTTPSQEAPFIIL